MVMNPEEARNKFLGAPNGDPYSKDRRRNKYVRAVEAYNSKLARIRKTIADIPEEGKVQRIKEGIGLLEAKVEANSEKLGKDQSDRKARTWLRKQRSLKAAAETVLAQVDGGVPLEAALEDVPVPQGRIGSYTKALKKLEDRGVAVRADSLPDAVNILSGVADFQMVILPRDLELPHPLAQRLFKDPAMKKKSPEEYYLDYLVECAFGERYRITLDMVRSNPKRYSRAFAYAKSLKQDVLLRAVAKDVASDLKLFEPAHLLKSRKRRAAFEKYKATPEAVFRAAFDRLSDDVDYLTFQFTGFDGNQAKIQTLLNNSRGLRIFLYSQALKQLENEGQKIRKTDIVRLPKKPSDHGTVARVMSLSEPGFSHPVYVHHVADFDTGFDGKLPDAAYSAWPDISGSDPSLGATYSGVLHSVRAYDSFFMGMHFVAAYAAYVQRAISNGKSVLCPVMWPRHDQVVFEQDVFNHVFVEQKIRNARGNLKIKDANRTETDMLLAANAKRLGYDWAVTTDFAEGKYIMKSMFGM